MEHVGLRMMRLGIFGGTFNPIHVGHLLLAEAAREMLKLDRVLFIPTRQPPHKRGRGLLPGDVRLKLIALAIRDHPAFVASDIELQREGPSYSIDTVKVLRQQFPTSKLFLLMGEDMLSVRWVAWDELKRLCTVVVAHRPDPPLAPHPLAGRPTTSVAADRQAGRPSRTEGGPRWLAMPRFGVSSSDIRTRLSAGRSIRYLVPASVERYIHRHQLYQRGGGR